MHFFWISNAPLLSKLLSPTTRAWYLWTDSGGEGKEGIIKWSMWPLQACFVMLSALWDKQPLAGQTFPISIHERWRPCASARLHLFLCYYISAYPLLYPPLPSYFTSVLSCACCMQADLLPPVNSGTSQNGSVEQEIEIIWGRGRSEMNGRFKWDGTKGSHETEP